MKSTLTHVETPEFIRAISCAATPVTIVTSLADDTRWGQTVSAVSRVSDEPAVLGVCINRRSPLNAVIEACSAFNVSLLGPGHHGVADSFAGRHQDHRAAFTFVDEEWGVGRNGLPVFLDSVATFECALHEVTEIGSHQLYLGTVGRVTHTESEPLLHLRGRYRTLSAHKPAPNRKGRHA